MFSLIFLHLILTFFIQQGVCESYPQRDHGEDCEVDSQCFQRYNYCIYNKCRCGSKYVYFTDLKRCLPEGGVGCEFDSDCGDDAYCDQQVSKCYIGDKPYSFGSKTIIWLIVGGVMLIISIGLTIATKKAKTRRALEAANNQTNTVGTTQTGSLYSRA